MKLSEIKHSTSNLLSFFRDLSTVPKQAPNSQREVSFHEFTIANHWVLVLPKDTMGPSDLSVTVP